MKKLNILSATMEALRAALMVFALLVVVAYLSGCAWFQEAASPGSDEVQALCVTACEAFRFTMCSPQIEESLRVGQMFEAVSELNQCIEECAKLPGRIAEFDKYLPCLIEEARNCEQVRACLE